MKFSAIAVLTLVALVAALPAGAKTKAKTAPTPTAAAAPDCPRAAYKGDPVCFGEDDGSNLPTPSAGAVDRGESKHDVRINDSVSVRGTTDIRSSDKNKYYLNNPQRSPHAQDVGGGAGVQYKF